jgi:hypothetical protein
MASFLLVAVRDGIAVRKQQRESRLVRMNCRRVPRHHVGTIEKPGDAAEAFGLTLREVAIPRCVQAHQLGVLQRPQAHRRFEGESRAHPGDCQPPLVRRVALRRKWFAIDGDRDQLDFVAIELQRSGAIACLRVAPDRKLCPDQGVVITKLDVQIHGRDQEGGWRVVPQVNGGRSRVQHDGVRKEQQE